MARYLMAKEKSPSPGADSPVPQQAGQQAPSESSPSSSLVLDWPANVPGPELADKILTRQVDAGGWSEHTESLLAELTEVESLALSGKPSPVDLTPLRNSVLIRWRFGMALKSRPPPGVQINTEALDALLSEADVVLASLQVLPETQQNVAAAIAAARGALAKDAVDLSEIAAAEAHRAAQAAVEEKATKKYERVARLVSVSSTAARQTVRSKLFWVVFAAVTLFTAGFHGYQYWRSRQARTGLSSDFPPGMLGVKDDATGITVLHVIDPTHPVDSAVLKELKAKAEASGKTLHQLAPNEFIVAPSAMVIPDMETSKKATK